MTDTDDSDDIDARTDGRTHGFVAGATISDDTDGENGGTPFVPTRGRDTCSDGESADDVPSTPTYGDVIVSVLREVCGR